MKLLLILLLTVSPLRQINDFVIKIELKNNGIFENYSNMNFKQNIINYKDYFIIRIENTNFYSLNLNYKIKLNRKWMKTADQKLRELAIKIYDKSIYLKDYFDYLSLYLKDIEYTENNLPQDANSVIANKKAHCIGFSNLASELLNAISIKNRFIRGFYLKKINKNTLKPIPHRWLEIIFDNNGRFFYDPQYQGFSYNYLVIKKNKNFNKIRVFNTKIIKIKKKMIF